MSTGERIKQIRKANKLTQEAFGASIGVTKAMVSHIENNHANFSKSALKTICNLYSINEEWLRTGSGEMEIKKTRNEEIAQFINDVMEQENDNIKKRLVLSLSKMNENEWDALASMIDKIKNAE